MLGLSRNARLILFRKGSDAGVRSEQNRLLRLVVCTESLVETIFWLPKRQIDHINNHRMPRRHFDSKNDLIALPDDWLCPAGKSRFNTVFYREDLPLPQRIVDQWKKGRWLTVLNGRFVTEVDYDWLFGLLHKLRADVVAVNVDPGLRAGHDKVLITRGNRIVGFRRYYEDTTEQAPVCKDWPDLLFVRTSVLDKLIVADTLCLSFPSFVSRCHRGSLLFRSTRMAGRLLDLDSPKGLLAHLENCPDSGMAGTTAGQNVRQIGRVFLGRNVAIGRDAVIIGPVLIGENATIARGALIRTSIIGPGVCVGREEVIDSQVVMDSVSDSSHPGSISVSTNLDRLTTTLKASSNSSRVQASRYRIWPRFSYARCFKRLADILAATVVLLLFAPVLPIIALVVKLTSSGPVFFRDRRQGLHGKNFNCIKFRTMVVGADKMQGKLRRVSQVDGPQFKMGNDPRVNKVGEFLRDTYIDEIPQFFNVFAGHMSVVGPRPSPAAENTLCAYWRDARLSVRPGITGLWQVCRTRQPMKDFQEWIHYDTEYVRNTSFRLDAWICWQTVKKMVMNFARQF